MNREKNSNPAHVWDALSRLLNCNRTQLAERLGVSRRTLQLWIAATKRGDDPGKNATLRADELLRSTVLIARARTEGMNP